MKRLLLAAIVSATAATGAGASEDALSNYTRTGEFRDCVPMRSTNITAVDDSTFIFRVGAGQYYLNETHGACRRADDRFTFIEIDLFSTSACRGETMRVSDRGTGGIAGACSLGEFERLERTAPNQDGETAAG